MTHDNHDNRDSRNNHDNRDSRNNHDNRDNRDNRDSRDSRDSRDNRDNHGSRDNNHDFASHEAAMTTAQAAVVPAEAAKTDALVRETAESSWFRLTLRGKIFLFNLALLSIFMLIDTSLDRHRLRRQAEEHLNRKIDTVCKLLEAFLPDLIGKNDQRSRERLHDITRKLTSPAICNSDNDILSVAILDNLHNELAMSSQLPEIDEVVAVNSGRWADVTRPIRLPGESRALAVLRIRLSTSWIDRECRELLIGKIWLSLFFTALAFLCAWLQSFLISKPLRFLLDAANKVAAGEFKAQIDSVPRDEIGILIDSFNKMTETITVHLEELRCKNVALDKQVFELSTLHQATRAINSVLNLDQLYECVVDTAISVLGGVKRCSLMLTDRRTKEFIIKVAKGLDIGLLPPNRRVTMDSGVAGRVLSSGEGVILNDLDDEHDSRFLGSANVVRSSLVVPLKRNEEVIGIISAGNKISGEPFSNKDLNMLESLAVQASIAIKNAKLYQDLNRKILELNTLHEVGKSLSMVLDLEKLLELILDMTARVLGGVKTSSLILYDEESGKLVVKLFKGMLSEQGMKPIEVGEGIAGKVFERGEPMMINNIGSEPEKSDYPTLVREGYLPRSSLCVPLRVKEATIGVLSVSDKLSGENFEENDLHMLMTLASQIAITLNNARLYEDLEASYLSAVRALANSLDAKDAYTSGHSERVARYSLEIGKNMNLCADDLKTLHIGALLHDIGKIGISEAIINKESRLDAREFEMIKTHPGRGAEIIEPAKFLREKVPLIKHHHERYDGRGYPDGIAGDAIPLLARIVCVADSYDAMTSKRAYREPMERAAAIQELIKCAGSQFDSRVVAAFLEVLKHTELIDEIERLGNQ